MTKEEVAQFLRVEPSTVYELTRKRSRHPLPFRRVGKYLRFSRTEVERWWNEAACESWWARQDSNLGPIDYEPTALTAELRALPFYTVLCPQGLVELLHAGLSAFMIWQNVVCLSRRDIRVTQDALDVFVIDTRLVQSRSETTPKGMPAEPCAVDVLGNLSSRKIVQIERTE